MTRFFYLLATVFVLMTSLPASAAATLGITAVFPTFVVKGTKGVPLTVVGNNFTPGSIVMVNGKPETTTVHGSTMAFFTLPVTPASVQITVQAADGAVSQTFPLRVVTLPTAPKSDPTVPAAPPTVAPTPAAPAAPAHGTWYVRPDGGTRYSANVPTGQCNGTANAAYSGTGTNQNCAFNDARMLWTDGSYCGDGTATSSCWKWIGQSGDTYMIVGSIADGVSYRVGQNGPNSGDWAFGLAGNPYAAGAPPLPNGTASAHTKLLGGNYASCSAQTARTQLHGGYGVGSVLTMLGASYVDVACLDITDFSSCGRIGQPNACHTSFPLDDYAGEGIAWNNKSTNDTITDVRIHGMASGGMGGPTGDGIVITDIALVGNPGSGWNADAGDGTTGTGSLLVQGFDISWNGCAEEYPIVHALPYQQCTDDNSGGYGDGFGTASVPSSPAWNVHFDGGTVSYNTQDGLDALHLTGVGTSVTFTRVLGFGNMGQQLKAGSGSSTVENSVVVTNCNAMRQAIPGTPAGYNSLLSDYCRAADTGMAMEVGKGQTFTFDNNTVYSDSATTLELDCDTTYGPCDTTTKVDYRNNVFLGFVNSTADGYPRGGTGDYANPIYIGLSNTGGIPNLNPFTSPGSVYSNNLTFHPKSNWHCPAAGETNAICGVDPLLADETWHVYGYPNAEPLSTSNVFGQGVSVPSISNDFLGQVRSGTFSVGAYQK